MNSRLPSQTSRTAAPVPAHRLPQHCVSHKRWPLVSDTARSTRMRDIRGGRYQMLVVATSTHLPMLSIFTLYCSPCLRALCRRSAKVRVQTRAPNDTIETLNGFVEYGIGAELFLQWQRSESAQRSC